MPPVRLDLRSNDFIKKKKIKNNENEYNFIVVNKISEKSIKVCENKVTFYIFKLKIIIN